MDEQVDWSLTTWEGNRRQQHREFYALSFREKLEIVEQLGEMALLFTERRRARGESVDVREHPEPPMDTEE